MKIDISGIDKVYNGKIGCMCGCLGKYSYNEGRSQYASDINVRSVKIIAKKVLTNPAVKFEEYWAFVEDRAADKNQVVYFVDEAAANRARAYVGRAMIANG